MELQTSNFKLPTTPMPLLSIVIANYNYGRFLETAITSVVNQCDRAEKCPDGVNRLRLHTGEYVELIICDANSADNSVEVIKKYEHCLAWWCSEKDKGQSDAFNKGFSHATGRFLTWLNADDAMIKGSLSMVAKAVRANPKCEWFVGGCINVNPDLSIVKCTLPRKFSKYEADGGYISVYGPSSIFSKDLLNRVGGVNEKFKGAMDTELWYKFYRKARVTYMTMPGFLFAFRFHPDSRTTGNRFEGSRISDPNCPVHAEFAQDMKLLKKEFPRLHRISKVGTVLHMQWLPWFRSRIITWQNCGKLASGCGYL